MQREVIERVQRVREPREGAAAARIGSFAQQPVAGFGVGRHAVRVPSAPQAAHDAGDARQRDAARERTLGTLALFVQERLRFEQRFLLAGFGEGDAGGQQRCAHFGLARSARAAAQRAQARAGLTA